VAAAPLLPARWLDGGVAGVQIPLPSPGAAADEPYWEAVKAQFLIRPGHVPLNAANLCPSPREVVEATTEATRDVDGDVSSQNRAKYGALRESVRERMAAYLGVSADEVALVRNTTEANNVIVSGLALGPGDEVLLFDQNHPTNNVAWEVRAARLGFTVRRVGAASPPASPDEVLETFLGAMGPRTRVVAFSDVSNTSGLRIPTRALCAACRERGIHAHVDGAQTFGADALDLRAMGCDSYSGSAHKWFMGPKEVGLLYVRDERIADVWPLTVGNGWGSGAETTARGARKLETLGQRDDAVFAGLAATLDFHERIGPTVVQARVRELATQMKEGLAAMGATLLTSTAPELSGGVVVARFEGVNAGTLTGRLYADHGIAGAPTGGLRFCPHVYNTRADVAGALAAVGELLGEMP
jgi:selenocysteine lyase/cysteine desulfurase